MRIACTERGVRVVGPDGDVGSVENLAATRKATELHGCPGVRVAELTCETVAVEVTLAQLELDARGRQSANVDAGDERGLRVEQHLVELVAGLAKERRELERDV